MRKGSKQSPEAIEKMRQANLGKPSSRKGTRVNDETLQRMREAQRERYTRTVPPKLMARGITKEQFFDAIAAGLKWCCGDHKGFVPASEFPKNSPRCYECRAKKGQRFSDGYSPERRRELADYAKDYRKGNPEYERRYRLLAKYGVTPEWYEETLELQEGHCALCDSLYGHVYKKTILFVDHNHVSGEVRGLLCAKCNTHLGILEAAPDWPERARAYLRKHGSL
jgi:hypothetical protein